MIDTPLSAHFSPHYSMYKQNLTVNSNSRFADLDFPNDDKHSFDYLVWRPLKKKRPPF